eukprot:CAMPEP_0197247882 /NCGR_PEP_ID=MMETSP1429-20130617/32537_1 /TAXON_ID=49237 /ORGANISM="Chaetoceros  sp., Strain UNC1202" /LENGTH=297 /DNA_ID=CAMNT_0042708927 /DNA_START=48 /DNA_END=941 /DNA_ORIENTATION=+
MSTIPDARFKDKHIIITGAGGNFGREGALFFALRGANVSAVDLNKDTLAETVSIVQTQCKCKCNGADADADADNIVSFVCNVTDAASVEAAVEGATQKFGPPDMLWNNAGYQGQMRPTLEYDIADFSMVMNINVTGMFTVMQTVAKRMAAANEAAGASSELNQHRYSIVNTASVAGMRGTPAMIAYSSSKAAVLSMTVAAAKDLAPHGIRVNAVSPALIGPGFMWDRQNDLHAKSGSPYFSTDPEQVAKGKVNGVPLKRLGSVEEVVKSVAYLLSDDSSYTTAINLVVDGGLSGGLR